MEIHDNLNPLIWNADNTLKKDVKQKLFEIIAYFNVNTSVPLNILDARIVGSNASYNYTPYSDLDLHLVVNFEDFDLSKELTQAYFDLRRSLFNQSHDISIHGIHVELYVEDINSNTLSNGIYSLYEDRWIKEPEKLSDIPVYDVSRQTDHWKTIIENSLMRNDLAEITGLINRLYMIRKNSLAVDGEYAKGNQIFKSVRNLGLLDELKDKQKELISKNLSLENLNK